MFTKYQTRGKALVAVIAAAIVIGSTVPAQASATPIIWNQRSSSTCLSWYQGYNGYCRDRMPNGTKFRMWCWADFRSYRGNYSSVRWFYGQSYHNGAWGWVHASYVYYQVRVGHC